MSREDLKPSEEWRALLLFAVVLLFSLVVDPTKESSIVSCVFSTPTHLHSSVSVCRFVMFQHCNKEEEKHDGLEAHNSEQISATSGPLTINLVAVDFH